mmetsp:Transcript_18232/g.2965  ORF Transcript_18232/g.2965 Transcript_18232/m.2965 type:complete len:92 (-) Transcript_18232:978-1253(-)
MIEVKPKMYYIKPASAIRGFLFAFAMSNLFDRIITVIIIINTFTMSLFYYGMSDSFEQFLIISNYIFVGCFTIEFGIKIIGLGPKYYYMKK